MTLLSALPVVEIVLAYQGASGNLIRAAVEGGAKGVVIAVAGAGFAVASQNEAMDYALDRGVRVIRSYRAASGRVAQGALSPTMTPAQVRRRNETIPAEDHAPLKARILAMLALAKTNDVAELARIFREYWARWGLYWVDMGQLPNRGDVVNPVMAWRRPNRDRSQARHGSEGGWLLTALTLSWTQHHCRFARSETRVWPAMREVDGQWPLIEPWMVDAE